MRFTRSRLVSLSVSLFLLGATPSAWGQPDWPGLVALEIDGKGVHFFAPVIIDGRRYMAHLDSGANTSTAFGDVLPELKPTGHAEVGGIHGVQRVSQTDVVGVSFGGEAVGTLRVDLRPGFGSAPGLPAPVAMSLGADVLFRKPLLLRPQQRELRFLDAVKAAQWPGAEVIPATFAPRKPCLVTARLGEESVRAMFDIGAGAGVVNTRHHGKQTPALTLLAGNWTAVDVNGEKRDTLVFSTSELSVGKHRFGTRTMVGIDLQPLEGAIEEQVNLILGADAIRECGWILDPGKQRILLIP